MDQNINPELPECFCIGFVLEVAILKSNCNEILKLFSAFFSNRPEFVGFIAVINWLIVVNRDGHIISYRGIPGLTIEI